MQKQKLLYISFGVIFLVLALFIVFYFTDTIGFNTKTHAEWEQNGVTFSYRGSKDEIRKLYIEKNGKKIGKFDISANVSLFSAEGSQEAIFLIDNEEKALALVPFSSDEDGDRHYRALYINADGSSELDLDNDISNPMADVENGSVFSECAGTEILVDSPDSPYKKYASYTGYSIFNDRLTPIYEISVTYHSETNIYCFSERTYDGNLGTLGSSDDDWLTPDEYAAQREKIDELFTVEIP
jgi:hypothetical protein